MKWVSSRDPEGRAWSFRDALFQGLAPDGGLFLPTETEPLPQHVLSTLRDKSVGDVAAALSAHLLGEELGEGVARALAHEAVDFPCPITRIGPSSSILELFHGPTLAFKDIGARFMAAAMGVFHGPGSPTRTILVATSGDTGGAVAHAFRQRDDVRVVILFPEGRVSLRQRAQLTTGGPSVTSAAVRGEFDDCQRMVKEAFADSVLRETHGLTSANSINVGRLLPQTFYYLYGALALSDVGRRLVVSVPSGNLGNLTAGLWARRLGAPIDGFVAGTNENRTLADFFDTGRFEPRASISTLSNAMDVGDPSNMERILGLYPRPDAVRRAFSVSAWSDDATRRCIAHVWDEAGVVLDPHTAVGVLALRQALAVDEDAEGLVLGTAHPAKFGEVVEPIIGRPIPVPDSLRDALRQETTVPSIPPSLDGLLSILEGR